MYNLRITATAEDLNTGEDIIFREEIKIIKTAIDARGLQLPEYWFPREMMIINDSGDAVEFNLFFTLEEYQHYQSTPTEHAFITIPKDFIIQTNTALIPIFIFVIRGVEDGSADKTLNIDFLNYISAGKSVKQ